uniref:Putative secreted protein n=1 Tax=Amblyomma triste TaxID=251400 RepID=A0A023G4M5_AMBTT
MFPLYVCTVIGLFVTAHTAVLERTEVIQESSLSKMGPQGETKPDCTHTKEEGYVYQSCSYTCEMDEAFLLTERQPCYIDRPKGVTGVCVDGECTTATDSPKEPAPQPPSQPQPVPEAEPQPQPQPAPQPQV